jgi:hypothetical protein
VALEFAGLGGFLRARGATPSLTIGRGLAVGLLSTTVVGALPDTILRATQFNELIDHLFTIGGKR